MSGFLASLDPRRVQWGAAWYAMHSRILRTKPVESMLEGTGATTAHGTKLAQVLTTMDLISLGVGSCVGTGMYVVSGLVAKEMAGPGVIVSFIIAAVASILSGKGEESYPDLLALVIAIIVTIIVALGVKNSVGFNNVLNVLNLAVWVFIMIAGLFFINGKYWAEGQFLPHGWSGVLQGAATCFYAFIGFDIIATTGEEAKNPNTSIPYAITASLVICLTAYVSVSMILTLMVPYSAIDTESPLMEMFVAHGFYAAKFVVAIGSVAGLTVSLLGSLFPMPRVIYAMAGDGLLFRFLAHVSSYTETPMVACIVSGFLAALLSLLVSLRDLIEMMSIGTLLAYTLVSVCVLLLRYQPESDIDGFVKFLSQEHTKKKEGILADCDKEVCSPVSEGEEFSGPATNTCGAKNLPSLGDNEMLIGKSDKSTYNVNHPNYGTVDMTTGIEADESENIYLIKLKKLIGPRYYTMRIRLGLPGKMDRPTAATGHTVTICVLLLFILMFIFCSFIIFGSDYISEQSWWAILLVVLMVLLISALVFVILQQPENPKKLPYMAPCLPFVPAFAMLVNIYLMLKLSTITWIRFAVWCFVGMLIYFGYGIWNSTLEISAREEALHQSTYQRYDVDDPFSVEEGFSYATEGESQENWGGPAEDKGFYYQQMSDAKANTRTSSKAKSKSKHKQNSEALIANDELDYSPE
ncbi:probable cationic amino acid transporter isoform X2 [Mustela nigripes]|uniref:probable cationic amino acid transporter isoform X2 n=1 Tax=Mustela lutreola TaxID=9666 RepID=UPI002796ED5A|nr:probable cationic amino acid transporter isoform X2 [Mustela lutreola]XP_059247544.1 probable cationic amino acid transporter isoform X2 [Mustela nigripes]